MYKTTTDDVIDFDKYDEHRLHMERLMKTHLVEFDINIRILCSLERAGIRTLGDLVKQDRASLAKIFNIGKLAIKTLEEFLASQDLSLGMK